MGDINKNHTGRSLRAFLLTTIFGATSQITTDFNALFRKLRLVPKETLDPEIEAKLDRIVTVSGRANPLK
jgi:hypothetical protein